MSKIEKQNWDERFSSEEYVYGTEPNVFLKEQLSKLSPGRLLMLGEGEGRNAVYAAKMNWQLSVEEALLAATSVGAELCGVGDRLGRIAPGYQFDAIVLDHEPTDLAYLSEPGAVTGVFQRGTAAVVHPRLHAVTATTTLRRLMST